MKRTVFSICAGLLLSGSAMALTLEEAMQEVVVTHPEIQERIRDFRAIVQDKDIAFAGYLPTLDFEAAAGRERSDNSNTNFDTKTLTRTEMAFILNWNIYRGNMDKYNLSRQEARLKAASHRVLEAINEKTLETASAYLELLKQNELLELAKENVEVHEKLYGQIEQRINSGIGAQSELEQASSRLALAQSNLIVTLNNFEDAMSNFEKVYGKRVDAATLSYPQVENEIPENFEILLEEGQLKNPSLNAQRANIEVATQNYKMSESTFLPSIDLELRQEWYDNVNGLEEKDDGSSVMLRFSYNLYNGGADKAQRQKRISELAKERDVFATMERQNKERLSLAWSAHQMIERQIKFLERHRDLSKKTLDLYTEEFSLGRRTLLDILDTENEYYGAKRELANAKYDQLYAKYRIFEQTGVLLQKVGGPGMEMVGMADSGVSKADELDSLEE
jgi:adhesin transport system outer membrane protein